MLKKKNNGKGRETGALKKVSNFHPTCPTAEIPVQPKVFRFSIVD